MVERHRTTAAVASVLPMGKALLTNTRLYQFPTRTVNTVLDEEERKRLESVLSDEKQREALKKSTALNTKRKSVFSKPKLLAKQNVMLDAPVNNMCVICLEPFKMDDQVRELPCYHEYHTACIDPWLTCKSCECPLCKFDCSDPKEQEKAPSDPDGLIAAESVPGLYGKILRSYLRFKSNRRNRLGQVGVTTHPDVEQPVRALSRQPTMTSFSPDFGDSFRPLETMEVPITTLAAMDEHFQAYEAQINLDEEQEEEDQVSYLTTDLPRQSTATDRTATNNSYHRTNTFTEENNTEARYSIATTNRDETDTIHTTTANSISTYAPTSDGGLLPDIDVSSISLCSIDLGGLSEDFHNTFNYHR